MTARRDLPIDNAMLRKASRSMRQDAEIRNQLHNAQRREQMSKEEKPQASRFRFRQVSKIAGTPSHYFGLQQFGGGGDWGCTAPMGGVSMWHDPQQSTGRTDETGVEMFEGDVVHVRNYTAPKVVEWVADAAAFCLACTATSQRLPIGTLGAVVVGNIYEIEGENR